MKLKENIMFLVLIFHFSYARPPMTQDKSKELNNKIKDYLEEYMDYHTYLKKVFRVLERDTDFKERIAKADDEEVMSGEIAKQLNYVNHNVRTILNEIKRDELDRLRRLAKRQLKLTNELDIKQYKLPLSEHLDHANPHTFEVDDLKKLIKKTAFDLEAANKQRIQQFKEYKMQKDFDKQQKLAGMDVAQKKEYMEQMKQEEDSKRYHQPIHHPGCKQQLLEVWKNQDHMELVFDPYLFFILHDVDKNAVWDADEVKGFLNLELDKVYAPGGPNRDLHERAEEMERMREQVFKENDKNRDGLIGFHEFIMETQRAKFTQDDVWIPINENQIYTQEEYEEFERGKLEELRYLQQHGLHGITFSFSTAVSSQGQSQDQAPTAAH